MDVPPILAQVNRDAVGARLLREQRGRHRVGIASAARLAHGRDVVDVDTEMNGPKAHRKPLLLRYRIQSHRDSPRLTMSCSTSRLCKGRSPRYSPQDPAEQPLGRAQATLVFQRLLAQRDQIASGVHVGVRIVDLGGARPVLELEHVTQVRTQRLPGCRVRIELEAVAQRVQQVQLENPQRSRNVRAASQLREAATIAGKNLRIGVATRREPQQQFVRVVAREQPLAGERIARGRGLHVREPAEVAALQPRNAQRHERLQQRALASLATRRAPRAARDEPHAAVRGRHALEQLARVPIGAVDEARTRARAAPARARS